MGIFWKMGDAFSVNQSSITVQDAKPGFLVMCVKQTINPIYPLETAHVSLAGMFQVSAHSSTVVLMP